MRSFVHRWLIRSGLLASLAFVLVFLPACESNTGPELGEEREEESDDEEQES